MTDTATLTHRRVLHIALPIVLSNITVPILGAVDTGVVGQLGEAAPIGAVGLGAVVIASVYWIFGFLRMGTTGLVSQARGAGDAPETGALLMRALLIGAGGGLVLILLQWPLVSLALQLAPGSEKVESLAGRYLSVRIWGAPAAIAVYAINGWLIAMERTRAVLVLQVWMNGLNVLLDLVFVLGLAMSVGGVAAATVLSEWSGLLLGLWLCREAFGGEQWRDLARIFDPVRARRMLAVNGDILVRTVLLQGCFTSFLFIGAGMGDVALAANQVLLQFLSFTAFALDGFAFAAEALVGSAMGAGNRPAFRRAAMLGSAWGMGLAVPLSLAFWFGGPLVIDLLATAPEVRTAGREYLAWIAIAPLAGGAAWMLDGIFIGATRTRDMRNAMALSAAIYLVAVSSLVPLLGNHGLWLALMVLNVARGLLLARHYPRLEASVGTNGH